MANVGSEIERKRKTESKKLKIDIKKVSREFRPSDLIIPLIVILLLIPIGLVVYPYINNVFENKREAEKLQREISKLEEKWSKLENLDSTEQPETLKLLNNVVPTDIEVSGFALKVREIAHKYDLEQQTLELEDARINRIETVSDVKGLKSVQLPDNVKVVSGPYTYQGEIDDIADFLDDLTTQGMLISVNDAEISKIQVDDNETNKTLWHIEFTVVGYTLAKPSDFTVSTPIQVVTLGTIEEALKADESNTNE